MYQYKGHDDTIAAIATPLGAGGIGIVRLSGPQALRIADEVARLKNGKTPSALKSFSVALGWVFDNGRIVDEVLVTLMRAPKSYTTQDVVELSIHGGIVTLQDVLGVVLKHGARLAEPGEFTKRAFLFGRIDLPQAEAVLDIIQAKTTDFLRVSQNQLKGDLSAELEAIREELMSLYTHIEALINFPEDDIDADGRETIVTRLARAEQRVARLLASSRHGRILKEGIRIVLCGKPNVGKSQLLNVLLKQERAIVTDIAGTTRDVLEEAAQIKGIPLQLVDTAGILEPRDLIEQEAVKRSHLTIDSADLLLLVLDAGRALEDADRLLLERLKGRRLLLVLNKSDLPQVLNEADLPKVRTIKISALQRTSIEALEQAIIDQVYEGIEGPSAAIIVTNARHIQALSAVNDLLKEAQGLVRRKSSWEFPSQNIKDAVNQCDALTGKNIDQDLLDQIFAQFCIGK